MKGDIPAITLHGEIVYLPKEKFRMRVAAYGFVTNKDKVLLVNTKSTGKWFVPGGEVETGERVEEALKREVFEETGIQVEVVEFLSFKEVFFYYEPLDEAFQNIALYYICHALTHEVTEENMEEDEETDKPTWVSMNTLAEENLQEGLYDIFQLINK